jgi:hypothetical protein
MADEDVRAPSNAKAIALPLREGRVFMHLCHYNFVRLRKNLRITPAMAAKEWEPISRGNSN